LKKDINHFKEEILTLLSLDSLGDLMISIYSF
jgi:hypothetical protein